MKNPFADVFNSEFCDTVDMMSPSEHLVPADCWSGIMVDVYHDLLPHWVVDHGCYALTFHCRDSLPPAALRKMMEIVDSESLIESKDDAFLEQSRRRFRIMEFYLDQSYGSCPFESKLIRKSLGEFLEAYDDGFRFRHWVVMPNHLHLLTEPIDFVSGDEFKRAIKAFKMKSTVFTNRLTGSRGSLWMRSGYDRWVRNTTEYQRWIGYLRENPVKAKLCMEPQAWIGLR